MFWFCKNATSGKMDNGIRNLFQLSASLSTTLNVSCVVSSIDADDGGGPWTIREVNCWKTENTEHF